MKKITALAAITLTALAIATPAQADQDTTFGGSVNAAETWAFTAAAVCFQELAVVPVDGAWTGNTFNHCVNGNVLNHPGS